MTENKTEFRRRVQIPTVDSVALQKRILSHPWFSEAHTVMAYCALPGEPDLTPVLLEVLGQGKCLLVPRCDDKTVMTARKICELSELSPGNMGILEPAEDAPIYPTEKIDLILVPGLAFDAAGRRMGRGKGYYDRFLENYHGKTMGICSLLVPEIPVEKHDVLMDAVVTAEQIFYRTEAKACLRKN